MCNISIFTPGVMPNYQIIENVTFNNPHGYGIVYKDNGRLEVVRDCPEKGNDPEAIYKLLEKNKDIERILHVRWKTDGDINLENTHPFTSYWSEGRQVYFMHNGVLHEFKPRGSTVTWENNVRVETPSSESGMSDSLKFNEEFLRGILLYGKGDIHDPAFIKALTKFWGSSGSRGLLIANDQPNLLINPSQWKTIKDGTQEFRSSNDDYFDNLTRGPVFEQRKAEAAKKEAATRFQNPTNSSDGVKTRANGWLITDLRDIDFTENRVVSKELKEAMAEIDLYSEEGLSSLGNLTEIDIDTFIENHKDEASSLLHWALTQYQVLFTKYDNLRIHVEQQKVKKNDASKK